MVGIPGSGKSTWIQNHKNFFGDNFIVISRDAIRFSILKEDDEYFSKEDEVWKEYVNQINSALEKYDNIILDATHLNEKSRSKVLRAINLTKDIEVNSIMINTSLNKSLEQNEQRTGRERVPRGQVRRMFFQTTKPSLDEGFDQIYIYNPEKESKYVIIKE